MALQLASMTLSPPVVLAPMAGITDLPTRRMVARFGAGLVVSEMVASQEVVQARPEARAKAELDLGGAGSAVQIAGKDAYWMAEAARLVEANGARVIDINMGCPSKRVTNGWSGAALLRDLGHALRLIEAVVSAVKVPVTLKTRLGWDDATPTAVTLAARAEGLGIAMVTIHGRTRCQFYTGCADWAAIRAVKDAVTIPVLANGDIRSGADAAQALSASGADGVMIGRGAQGRPWALAEIAHALGHGPAPQVPQGAALAALVEEHHTSILSFYGAELGLRVARKHLGWYMENAGVPKALRGDVLTADSPAAVVRGLRLALSHGERLAA